MTRFAFVVVTDGPDEETAWQTLSSAIELSPDLDHGSTYFIGTGWSVAENRDYDTDDVLNQRRPSYE